MVTAHGQEKASGGSPGCPVESNKVEDRSLPFAFLDPVLTTAASVTLLIISRHSPVRSFSPWLSTYSK